jgi:hypothetical protein
VLARLAAPDGVIQVGMPGQQADEAVRPPEQDLSTAQVAHPLDLEPQRLELGDQRARADVHQVPWQVQVQPSVAEQPGLEAGRVGHGDDQHPAGNEQVRGVPQRPDRLAEVLERVPEDNRRPGAGDVLEPHGAHGRMIVRRVRVDADRLPAMPPERGDEGPVAGADVKDRSARQGLVQLTRQGRPGALERLIAHPAEPARLRSIPARVRRAELFVTWPRRRRGHAAPRAPDPARQVLVVAVKAVTAPSTLTGGWRVRP